MEIGLYEYWLVIQRHRRLALAVFAGVFLITAFFTFHSPNIYEAQTTFYYPLMESGGMGGAGSAVFGDLGGKQGSPLVASLLSGGGGSEMQNYTKGVLESRRLAEILNNRLHLQKRLHMNESGVVQMLRGGTQVKLTDEGIMQINVQSSDPRLAATIANGYVDAFREFSQTSTLSLAKKHRVDVEKQIAALKKKLSAAEAGMTAFQLQHKTADFSQSEKVFAAAISSLQQEEVADQIALRAVEGGLARVTAVSASQLRAAYKNPLVLPGSEDPIVVRLRMQLSDLYVRYSQARLTETPANPELKSYKAQIQDLESALRDQFRKLLTAQSAGVSDDSLAYRVKIAQISARKQAVEQGVKKLEDQFKNYPGVGLQYMKLADRLKILNTLNLFLATEYEKAKLDEAKESPDFEVLDAAVPPEAKIGPHRGFNLMIGFFLGIFLGIAAAFAVEASRPRLQILKETDGRAADYELELAEKPKP